MLPRETFPDLNSLLSHSDRILASCIEALQIGGLFHQGQFPYCSGYESRRVQTIFQINLKISILLKILIMKNLTDFLTPEETGITLLVDRFLLKKKNNKNKQTNKTKNN